MSYDPSPVATIADGSITSAKLGGDITDLAKDVLVQSTPEDAKTVLEVTAGGGGGVPAFTI